MPRKMVTSYTFSFVAFTVPSAASVSWIASFRNTYAGAFVSAATAAARATTRSNRAAMSKGGPEYGWISAIAELIHARIIPSQPNRSRIAAA